MNKACKILLVSFLISTMGFSQTQAEKDAIDRNIKADIQIPYKRPIGFTYNIGSITSMTFEGRFFVGVLPNITLVLSPSYQNTPRLPFYHPFDQKWAVFDFRRLNLGIGGRAHFYEYDSWDGWYIEAMGRTGITWLGTDDRSWSVIPSLIFGYQTVYDAGYTINFGFGFEWEFLFGEGKHPNRDFLKTAYFETTKLPLTGELSIGWTW
jgi:hypothetical protein